MCYYAEAGWRRGVRATQSCRARSCPCLGRPVLPPAAEGCRNRWARRGLTAVEDIVTSRRCARCGPRRGGAPDYSVPEGKARGKPQSHPGRVQTCLGLAECRSAGLPAAGCRSGDFGWDSSRVTQCIGGYTGFCPGRHVAATAPGRGARRVMRWRGGRSRGEGRGARGGLGWPLSCCYDGC